MNLKKEIKINSRIIIVMILVIVIIIGISSSYALFQTSVKLDNVVEIQTGSKLLKPNIGLGKDLLEYDIKTKKEVCNPTIEEDGITYLSGDNNCIDFNYVWYSGKLWRITALYPDGTMKMITDDMITAIAWNANTTYEGSWVQQWLNEDFKETLYNYENIIVKNSEWNVTADENDTPVKPPIDAAATIVKADIGLLNAYEYYQSYKNTNSKNGYLNISYYTWWLITPFSSSEVRASNSKGEIYYRPPVYQYGIRPSINLKSDIKLKGVGTKDDPYRIVTDKEVGKSGELINTRLSGEYVKIDNEVYRIVETEENKTTKITSVDFAKDENGNQITKKFSEETTSYKEVVSGGDENYLGAYLNNTWLKKTIPNYEQILTRGTYYLGEFSSYNYKNLICANSNTIEPTKTCEKTTAIWTGYVGLPRSGEMFSSQLNSDLHMNIWTITPYGDKYVMYLTDYGSLYYDTPTTSRLIGTRPSINLKPEIKITGGSGTEQDPYEIIY